MYFLSKIRRRTGSEQCSGLKPDCGIQDTGRGYTLLELGSQHLFNVLAKKRELGNMAIVGKAISTKWKLLKNGMSSSSLQRSYDGLIPSALWWS